MAIDPFNYYAYIMDNGDIRNVRLQASTGAILGLANVNIDANPPYPYARKNLRHITGRNAAGTVKRTLTIPDKTNALYDTDGTQTWVDKEGNTIIREGRFGDKRPARYV